MSAAARRKLPVTLVFGMHLALEAAAGAGPAPGHAVSDSPIDGRLAAGTRDGAVHVL